MKIPSYGTQLQIWLLQSPCHRRREAVDIGVAISFGRGRVGKGGQLGKPGRGGK